MNIPPLLYINNKLGKKAAKDYATKRNALSKAVKIPYLIIGVTEGPNGKEPWAHCNSPIYQEPLLLYLTGINQPQTALFVDPVNEIECLFLPEYNDKSTFWDGKKLCYNEDDHSKEAQLITRIENIYNWQDCHQFIQEYIQKDKLTSLGMLWHQNTKTSILKDNNYMQMKHLKRKLPKTCTLKNISDEQWALRAISTATENQLMDDVQEKTKIAFESILRKVTTCETEYELSGILHGECLKKTPYGLSFNPIVASGEHATTLHYITNDSPITKNSMILLDFGLCWHTVISDISRTIPANGTYNPLQALLYQIVLDTQIAVEAFIKPGKTISECNTYCWRTLEKLLKERFFAIGGTAKRDYETSPHYVSHRIGVQVHDGDPFGKYRENPLQVGTIISNEPGLYGHFECTINGKKYKETIGIRIEDNLRISKTGVINTSKDIPKTIKEIEALLQETI